MQGAFLCWLGLLFTAIFLEEPSESVSKAASTSQSGSIKSFTATVITRDRAAVRPDDGADNLVQNAEKPLSTPSVKCVWNQGIFERKMSRLRNKLCRCLLILLTFSKFNHSFERDVRNTLLTFIIWFVRSVSWALRESRLLFSTGCCTSWFFFNWRIALRACARIPPIFSTTFFAEVDLLRQPNLLAPTLDETHHALRKLYKLPRELFVMSPQEKRQHLRYVLTCEKCFAVRVFVMKQDQWTE